MAKKSAKSKGYRRQNAKKPYLSKRDIGIMCAIVALLAIGAFFLFRYDDGALKVQDGVVATDGDNWLIVDGSNVRGRARYFKLGEIGEIDGFTRQKSALSTDPNVPQYAFTPSAEPGVDSVTVFASHNGAQTLAQYTMASMEGLESVEMGPLQTAEMAGQTVSYYVYDARPTEADADAAQAAEPAEAEAAPAGEADAPAEESAGEAPFSRSISGYFDATHDSCIVVRAQSGADTAEGCLGEDALIAALEQAVAAVTLEPAKP